MQKYLHIVDCNLQHTAFHNLNEIKQKKSDHFPVLENIGFRIYLYYRYILKSVIRANNYHASNYIRIYNIVINYLTVGMIMMD